MARGRNKAQRGLLGGFFHALLSLVFVVLVLLSLVGVIVRSLPEEIQALPYLPAVAALTPAFALLALVTLICAMLTKRWVVSLLALVCVMVQVWYQYPFFVPSENLPHQAIEAVGERVPDINDGYARVMTANVYKGQASPQYIVNLVKNERVEVLALQETTSSFVKALDKAGIGDFLPYSQISSSDGKYGNGLWSLTPFDSPADDDVHSASSFMPGGTVSFGDGKGEVRFVSVHTTSPTPGTWEQWRQSLDDLAGMKLSSGTRYVYMGDFNASYDHTAFRSFLSDRFRDAAHQSGHGLVLTWPDNIPRIPRFVDIDHIVVDRGITAGQVEAVTLPGSDHAALLATLAM